MNFKNFLTNKIYTKTFHFALLALLLFSSNNVRADHLMGADLSYECLGNNQYVISLSVYRNCDGTALDATEWIMLESTNCNFNRGFHALQLFSQEVFPLCAADIPNSKCNSSASNALPGVEHYLFQDTITLYQSCSDWRIFWPNYCRNTDITTIQNAGLSYLHIETIINNTVPYCNSSPYFTTKPVHYYLCK